MARKYTYHYVVCREADNSAFLKACGKIEKALPNCRKDRLLVDVDGTLVQMYYEEGRTIVMQNDYEVDAVYVDAEMRLDDIFGKPVKVYTKE